MRWTWDGDVPAITIDSSSGPAVWVFEPGTFNPLVKIVGGRAFGVITDQIGAPTHLFDQDGAIAWTADYDLYGAARVDERDTSCPFRWPGQMTDEETGLVYNRWRYYDPRTGRYVSPDPLSPFTGTNAYRYVSVPLIWADPFGLFPLFRGTSVGYLGNPFHVEHGITPATTHPGVAAIFGTESSNYGHGIVEIFTDADLAGVELIGGNHLASIEREVGVELTPAQLAERASVVIDASDARAILSEMGIDIPARIWRSEQSFLCESLRNMTEAEIDQFVERARERAALGQCGT